MSTQTFTRDDLKNFIRNMKTLEEDQNSTAKVLTESIDNENPELDVCKELIEGIILELVTRQQKADRGSTAPFNLGNGIFDAKMSGDSVCEQILQMAADRA